MSNVNSLFSANLEGAWEALKRELSARLGGESGYDKFFESMVFDSFDAGILQIELKSEVAVDFAKRYYAARIRDIALPYFDGLTEVKFVWAVSATPVAQVALSLATRHDPVPQRQVSPAVRHSRTESQIDSAIALDATQHFGTFAVGNSNQQAFHSARRVAENPGLSSFNPLFLHGGPGLGKTHLLHAVAWYAKDNQTARRIVYRTADELKREYFAHLNARKSSTAFQGALRQADILLIDDVQFLIKQEHFQREIVSLIDYLVSQRKQVILVSDRPPSEITKLTKSLADKCESGLVFDVRPPEHELRKDVLRQLVHRHYGEYSLSADVVDYLSQLGRGDVRELTGLLTKVIAYCDMNREPVSIERVRQLFGDLDTSTRPEYQRLTLDQITQAVSVEYGVEEAKIISRSRIHSGAMPRKICMYLARSLTDLSLHSIGAHYNRDYSTVIFNLKAAVKMISEDEKLAARVANIRNSLLSSSNL